MLHVLLHHLLFLKHLHIRSLCNDRLTTLLLILVFLNSCSLKNWRLVKRLLVIVTLVISYVDFGWILGNTGSVLIQVGFCLISCLWSLFVGIHRSLIDHWNFKTFFEVLWVTVLLVLSWLFTFSVVNNCAMLLLLYLAHNWLIIVLAYWRFLHRVNFGVSDVFESSSTCGVIDRWWIIYVSLMAVLV